MKKRAIFMGLIIIAVLTVIFVISYPRIMHARAQEELVTDLTSRLEQAGVKVVSIELKDKSSLIPEITIQKTAAEDELSGDDIIALHLTEREAVYSYLFGHRLDGYILITIGPNKEPVSWEQAGLNIDEVSKKINPFTSPVADDNITKKLIETNLDLMGLHLDQVKVKTGIGSSKDVQLAEIYLSTNNLDLVNSVSRTFLESLRPLINKLNQETGVRIAILMVHLMDSEGNPLLEYLWDVQLDIVRSDTAKQINPWYSEPPAPEEGTAAPTPIIPAQTNEPFSPPNPLAYPPPSNTPYP